MTAIALPTATVDPQRMLFDDGIWRSAIRQPLYSSAGLDNAALPGELSFFQYGLGQLVPGAGNAAGVSAKLIHTNMTVGGQLAAPKKFRCDGVRVSMMPIAFTATANTPALSDPSFGTAAQDSELLEDLLLLVNSCFLQVKIGEKFYANHPLSLFPANQGFGGLAAVSNDNAGATAVNMLDVVLPHTVGNGLNFRVYPFLIEAQQGIQVSMRSPWATPPSLNDDRLVTVWLSGNLYREVS